MLGETAMQIPEEVRTAAEALAQAREEGKHGLELARFAQGLWRAERRAGVTADGGAFVESATAARGRRSDAIAAMCAQCIVDPAAAGSGATQVELCPEYTCPLWLVRPVRTERVPYSDAVLREQGLSRDEARFRLEHPRERPGAGA